MIKVTCISDSSCSEILDFLQLRDTFLSCARPYWRTIDKYNLLNTSAFITFPNVLVPRRCLTQFICHKLPKYDETVFVICSSKLRVESTWSPRSRAEEAKVTSFPSRVTWKPADIFFGICGFPVPSTWSCMGWSKDYYSSNKTQYYARSCSSSLLVVSYLLC